MTHVKLESKPFKLTSGLIALTFLFTTIFEGGNLAFAVSLGSNASSGGNQSAQLSNISESSGAVQSFQPDLFTGRAQTGIPIFIPPGRKNVQPNLNLSYSSSSGNGWLGVGWSLDLGFIQRNIKKGVPGYDSDDTFIFSFQGVNSELVEVTTDVYRAKDEALFLKFEYDDTNDKWTVTDKSGTKHTFGGSASCRQSGPGSDTFRWNISKVIDTKGNYMTVTHQTLDGHVYLDEIEYNGNETQSFAHTHKVEFTLEDRNDDFFSYISGVKDEVKKRLQKIEVKVKDSGGTWNLARKYNLTYSYSTATDRSLLTGVEECGTDGTTCLPETEFTYEGVANGLNAMTDYTNVDDVFSDNNYDVIFYGNSNGEVYANTIDLNGDGFQDRVITDPTTTVTNWKVQYGSQNGFANPVDFGPVERTSEGAGSRFATVNKNSNGQKTIADLVDMNGDGLPDRVMAEEDNTNWKVQYNHGDGFDDSVNFGPIEDVSYGSDREYIRRKEEDSSQNVKSQSDLVDMNGDGLPDRVVASESYTNWKVQLNNGSGFEDAVNWGTIEIRSADTKERYISWMSTSSVGTESTTLLIDINGDGLPDRIIAQDSDTNWQVQYNNGSGFETKVNWGPINSVTGVNHKHSYPRFINDGGEAVSDLVDLNGDGLVDRVVTKAGENKWHVQWNTGTGFTAFEDFEDVEEMVDGAAYEFPRKNTVFDPISGYTDLIDINGDGVVDRVQSDEGSSVWKAQLNKNTNVDLLEVVDNGRGGTTTITYKASTLYDNTDTNDDERLPFSVWTVSQVDQADGMGNTYTTTYDYAGGMFDADEREFRGFRRVTVTDALETQTKHWFHQEDNKRGRLEKKEVWGREQDSNNKLDATGDFIQFSKEETTWSTTQPHGGSIESYFVHVTQQDNYIYDGEVTPEQVRQRFTYDSYGNLASTIEDGDINVTGDERRTENVYTYNTTKNILNTLKKTTLYDAATAGNKISERAFFYDGATSIDTAPTEGLLTREQEWMNPDCADSFPNNTAAVLTCHPTTVLTYNNYGSVKTVKDPLGNITTNTYESTYKLFLVTIKNALNHEREFTYDEKIAQIKTSTDQNDEVTTTEYDVLGRVTKVIEPGDDTTNPTQRFTYTDWVSSTAPNKVKTEVKSSASGESAAYLTTYSFTDGMGREIQRRSPAESGSEQAVTNVVEFNARGEVSKEYTPFFDTDSTSFRTSTQMSLSTKKKVEFFYDAVGRRTRIDYPDSTNSQVEFNQFVKTTIDQRGKKLRYTNDAYGRLTKVEEFNNNEADIYTTTYTYDDLNNLKTTTDNASNVTTITYDSLSRKITMDDPDMGEWDYEYDKNDNLTKQTDAKNQVIEFTYDALNRVTLKDLPAGETDVTYNYDSAPSAYTGQTGYWTGRLAKVIDASGTHEFKYDKRGRVVKDKKTVDAAGYEFERTYDSMGRVRTLIYPDTEVVTYTYNGMGDVETISGVKSAATTHYIKDVDYNAAGQITHTTYGNDVTSDYSYDSNTLRLESILTKKSDTTTKLQELDYTFDNNGNVTEIDDTVNSMTQDFTYDDLNRLTQAIGSAYGTQDFTYDSIGNMTNKDGQIMAYGAGSAGPHAVTSVTGTVRPTYCPKLVADCTFTYDSNGNMTDRGVDDLTYDSENRLTEIDVFEGTTATKSYNLATGWNAVSFTYLPEDRSVESVLSELTFNSGGTQDYSQVSYWNEATDEWEHYVGDSDFNDFDQLEHGKTYQIYVDSTTNMPFDVTGTSPAVDLTHSIVSGDNYISPAVTSTTAVATVLSGVTYTAVYEFNTTSDTWVTATNFEVGKGYKITASGSDSFDYGGASATTTTFVYDSTGARVKKTAGGTTTVYLGKDYDKTGSDVTKYIFLGDRRIATRKNSDGAKYIHGDHINSSNVITDASENRVGYHEYDPYGSTVVANPDVGDTVDPKHKFTGQEEDSSAKHYNYNARLYDPQLGRFITADWLVPDPADPQMLNRYSYARNNPIRYEDPTGNFIIEFFVAVAIGAAVGAAISAGINAYQQLSNTGKIDAGQLGKAALTGAIAGAAAGGAAFGAAAAVGWMASTVLTGQSGALLLGTFNATGIVGGGAVGGYVGNGVSNVLYDQSFNDNAGTAIALGAAFAFVIGGKQIINGFKHPTSVYFYDSLKQTGLVESPGTRNGGVKSQQNNPSEVKAKLFPGEEGDLIHALSKKAAQPYDSNYTKAGHAFTKHAQGQRAGSKLFPKLKGNPQAINSMAQDIVQDILQNPRTTYTIRQGGHFGSTIKFKAPDGRGVVFDRSGNLRYFSEG